MESERQHEGVDPVLLDAAATERAQAVLGRFFPDLNSGELSTLTSVDIVAAITHVHQTVADLYIFDNPKNRLAEFLPVLLENILWGVNFLDLAIYEKKHFLYYTDELHKLTYFFTLKRSTDQTFSTVMQALHPDKDEPLFRDLTRLAARKNPRVIPPKKTPPVRILIDPQ